MMGKDRLTFFHLFLGGLLLLPLSATAQTPVPNLELPPGTENYRPKPVVSLIVSGRDRSHALQAFEKLVDLHKKRGVRMGNVFVVGADSFDDLLKGAAGQSSNLSANELKKLLGAQASQQSFVRYAADVGLVHYEFVRSEEIIDRFKLEHSPTWVVRHLGQDYVFEGFVDPSRLFGPRGDFLAGNP